MVCLKHHNLVSFAQIIYIPYVYRNEKVSLCYCHLSCSSQSYACSPCCTKKSFWKKEEEREDLDKENQAFFEKMSKFLIKLNNKYKKGNETPEETFYRIYDENKHKVYRKDRIRTTRTKYIKEFIRQEEIIVLKKIIQYLFKENGYQKFIEEY